MKIQERKFVRATNKNKSQFLCFYCTWILFLLLYYLFVSFYLLDFLELNPSFCLNIMLFKNGTKKEQRSHFYFSCYRSTDELAYNMISKNKYVNNEKLNSYHTQNSNSRSENVWCRTFQNLESKSAGIYPRTFFIFLFQSNPKRMRMCVIIN